MDGVAIGKSSLAIGPSPEKFRFKFDVGVSGIVVSKEVTVLGPPTIVSFTASPKVVKRGESVTLHWQTESTKDIPFDCVIEVIAGDSVGGTGIVRTLQIPECHIVSSDKLVVENLDEGSYSAELKLVCSNNIENEFLCYSGRST